MSRGADPARRVALAVLRALDEREAFLQPSLEAEASRARLDSRDRGFALELVMGVERWRARLDHSLSLRIKRGLDQTEAVARDILRLGAYQLIFLDRVPPRAAVHSAVELAREARGEGLARFVNGVLRAVAAQGESLPKGDSIEALATRLSQPAWLIERWLAEGGPAHATQVAEGYNHPAPLTIRLDGAAPDREALAARLTAEGATVQPTAHAPDGLHIESAGSPFAGEAFGAGWWQAQDEASQLVVLLLDPQPGERVWDACAAPGGKARYIARRLGETGALLATDAHEAKARRLAEGFGGMKRVQVRAHDATTAPSERPFDRVLLDAPCSGLGVMRRHPEIKWRRTLEDVQARAALQARLLDAAARAVRPGGVLVYSVCTETAEEGPDQVARFLETHRDFAPETPEDADVRWSALLDAHGALRLRPHLHGADGFFALRLRRKGSP